MKKLKAKFLITTIKKISTLIKLIKKSNIVYGIINKQPETIKDIPIYLKGLYKLYVNTNIKNINMIIAPIK